MKAMVFAAGLGTRLRPLTDHRPKALVELKGRPLLEWNLLRLKRFGVSEVVVNVHHFAEQIEEFLLQHDNFGLSISVSDERAQLLETGGGLWHAASFFESGKAFFVVNADVICDLDLSALADFHHRHHPLASLVVMDRSSSRKLTWGKDMQLCGWKNSATGESKTARGGAAFEYAFSGIQMIDPRIFSLYPREGAFSLIDVYLELASTQTILAHPHEGIFLDLGTPEKLAAAEAMNLDFLLH